MSAANVPKRASNETAAAHNEAQAQPQGEAASYFDQTQSLEELLAGDRAGSSGRHASDRRASNIQSPYGYPQNAGEAGETYTGTAPAKSYQHTLPDPPTVPTAPTGEQSTTEPAHHEHPDGVHNNHVAGQAMEGEPGPSQEPIPPPKQHGRPEIKPGKRGTIRGFVALARNKPHVRDGTPARLELLRRADKFFNEGFVGKHGRLNHEKKARFQQEIERSRGSRRTWHSCD